MLETIGLRGLRRTRGDKWCKRCMRRLGLNESDMNGQNEFARRKVEDPVARTIIAIANEHASEGFRR
jgi:PIN domain nuclease of toxin-antitoxin system